MAVSYPPIPKLAPVPAPRHASVVSETMESARRWSGFVCPDCRFVFRVPRDHDGQGVVCPSCRRLMRIPTAGDRPAPLVVPLEAPTPEEAQLGAIPSQHSRRKKKKSRSSENPSWDAESTAKPRRSGRDEKRQMFWMLAGGSTLLVVILAVIFMATFAGDQAAPVTAVQAAPDSGQTADAEPVNAAAIPALTDAAFVAAAEPIAKKFLEAKSAEELISLIRNPDVSAPRLRGFYPNSAIEPVGLSAFNSQNEVVREGLTYLVGVRTRDFEEKAMVFVNTPDGPRIDWESWVGWSEMTWEQFLKTKPATPHLFRVNLNKVEYYNMAFSDEGKWQSHRLLSPDGMVSIYGYAERGSITNSQLHIPPDASSAPFTLMIRFPESGEFRDQVIIDKVLAEGWVLDKDANP